MIIHHAKPLFAGERLENRTSMNTIRELLAARPHRKLRESLRNTRPKERNHYPVTGLGGVLLLRGALRNLTTEAGIDEFDATTGSDA